MTESHTQVTGIGHLMEGYPAEPAQHQAIGHFDKVFGVPAYLQVCQPAPAVSFHQRTYLSLSITHIYPLGSRRFVPSTSH